MRAVQAGRRGDRVATGDFQRILERRIIYVMLTKQLSRGPAPNRKGPVRHLEFDRSLPRVMLLFHASTGHRHKKRDTRPRFSTNTSKRNLQLENPSGRRVQALAGFGLPAGVTPARVACEDGRARRTNQAAPPPGRPPASRAERAPRFPTAAPRGTPAALRGE